MISWVNVKSKAIRRIGYDSSTSRMYIDFKDSKPQYSFCRVPEHVFTNFVNASSIGKHYHAYIKGRFEC